MATKNFLFLLAFSATVLATGCQTFERRQSNQKPSPPGGPVIPALPEEIKPTPGRVLPVGIFLSPGGLKTFAEIGVLRVLQRAKVPIVAIGGSEWGSIVAANFAFARGVNEVEWQMLKLRRDQLPSSTLLRQELVPRDPRELFSFLRFIFADRNLESSQVPFFCSTTDGEQTIFISRGRARDQIIKCAALPPLYKLYEGEGMTWVSGAVNPGDWPSELKKAGAQFIVYVDVISHGQMIARDKYQNDQQIRALWTAVKSMSRQQHAFANLTIEVPLDIDLGDFEHRREAIAAGESVATSRLSEVLKAIGM